MKKLKKFLAGVVTLAMAMSMMTMTAFAAPTIEDSKDGNSSLTIHKYEYNGDEKLEGTGSASDKVPDGANPLAGAGFTIYKVVDKDGMDAYYSKNPTALPSIDTYVDENGVIKSAYAGTKVGEELFTGTDGIAKFDNLNLGFYVVIETTKPPAVTSAVEPFLVSIPMTTVDGADWLYDVHVFPKNGTKYGKVELEKTGTEGAKLEGVTFILEKQNGDKWDPITAQSGAGGDNTGSPLSLTTNASGIIKVENLSQGTYRFIETSVGENANYIMDGKTPYVFVVTDQGQITYNGETADTITIPVTNEKPDFKKEVSDGKTWGLDADYSVGDAVPYKLTIKVPEKITDLKTFAITDTPTNLQDKVETIKVKFGDTDVPTDVYTTEAVDGVGFKIKFDTKKMASYAGQEITVTYDAELLSSAVTTTAGNPNEATLEYSNKILPEDDPEDETHKIKDHATVYTFKIQILKRAEDANGDPLKGVVFDLYREAKEGETGVANADELGLPSGKSWVKVNEHSLVTDDNGEISQSGLANDVYYLVETKTNAEYNLLKAPVLVTLNIQYTTTTKAEYTTGADGKTTLIKHEIETTEFTGATDNVQGIFVETVINKKGFTLPTTGGMGTFVFTFVGVAMMAAAVILFFTSKKKEAK